MSTAPKSQDRSGDDVTTHKTPTSALSKVTIQHANSSLRPHGSMSPTTINSQSLTKTPEAITRDQKILALANEGHLTPVQVARLKEKGTLPPDWQPPELGSGPHNGSNSDFRQARE